MAGRLVGRVVDTLDLLVELLLFLVVFFVNPPTKAHKRRDGGGQAGS